MPSGRFSGPGRRLAFLLVSLPLVVGVLEVRALARDAGSAVSGVS
jgi:hypothetical protein